MRRDAGGLRRVQGRRVLLRTRGRSYSPTAGLPFDDAELESKLVWIWGSPRSGSTWLLEMLCHPFRMDPESDLGFAWREGWDGAAPALPVNEFQIAGHLAPAIYGDFLGDATLEAAGEILPRTLNRVTEYYSSYSFSAAYADVWKPEARRLTLVRLHAVLERARDQGLSLSDELPLLAIKEVNGSHGADLVMPLFPHSRMILLVRDGRDVLDSMLDANSPGGWLLERNWGRRLDTPERRREFVRETALQWTARMNACRRAYEAHDPALRIEIRYEDLRADTAGRLAELEGWLGLPSGPKRMESIAAHHSFDAIPKDQRGPGTLRRAATPGRWRESLSEEEQSVAGDIMGSLLAELGYEE